MSNSKHLKMLIWLFGAVFVVLAAAGLAVPAQAADTGTGSQMVNVIQTITTDGSATSDPAQIKDIHSLKSIQKVESQAQQTFWVDRGHTKSVTMPAGNYIVVAVNPQVASLAANVRPTANPKANPNDGNRLTAGDIIVQY